MIRARFIKEYVLNKERLLHVLPHQMRMFTENELAMNLGETYLVTSSGNKRLGKKKIDLVIG